MNILLFLIAILISFVVVRIGAIAFQLTGLEWSFAKFQSLSCFTGTGFTTREAELIAGSPRRRRIASILMVLGNAGLVALIATFANTLRPRQIPKIELPFTHLVFPSYWLPWINLGIVILSVYILYRLLTSSRVARRFTELLRKRMVKRSAVQRVTFEELMVATQGYGASSIEIHRDSPLSHHTIREAKLRRKDINILAIEKKGEFLPNPAPNIKIEPGDRLVCFGKLETIRKEIVEQHE